MRACVVVGAAEYDDVRLLPLNGTVVDADRMYELLCDAEYGSYAAAASAKLTNPTLDELRSSLEKAVLASPNLDVFTLFFAGHGEIQGGTFYMMLRDTRCDRLSRTAFSITELLNILNEARPKQANIIIDACHAGGVALDLPQVFKSDNFDTRTSSAISIFVSARANQAAVETDLGSLATQSMAAVLKGEVQTGSVSPYLDLVVVGEKVSQLLKDRSAKQHPVYWALNFAGASHFTRNPHTAADEVLSAKAVIGLSAHSSIAARLETRRQSTWEIYRNLERSIQSAELIRELVLSISLLDASLGEPSEFITGLSSTFVAKAGSTNDRFAASQVLAACGAALVSVAATDPRAPATIDSIAWRLTKAVSSEAQALHADLEKDWRCLLGRRGGFCDLVILPIRISKLLGYLGAAHTLASLLHMKTEDFDYDIGRKITECILERYHGSLRLVSDCQAAYLALFFSSPLAADLPDCCEQMFGFLFNDFLFRKGMILRADFNGKDAFTYTLERAKTQNSTLQPFIARPTASLALLLLLADKLSLAEAVDPYLSRLDHSIFNVFVAKQSSDLAQRNIEGGTNVTFQIGQEDELGVFNVGMFKTGFEKFCRPRIAELTSTSGKSGWIAGLLASLVLPDRVAWQAFSGCVDDTHRSL